MMGTNLSKIAAALVISATTLGIAPSASAQGIADLLKHKQNQKNNWRNLGIAGGAAGVLGLLTHNKALTVLGLGGGLYSTYRYEQDRKGQSKAEQQRAALFSRSSFVHNGHKYVRHTKVQNGQKYYYFKRA